MTLLALIINWWHYWRIDDDGSSERDEGDDLVEGKAIIVRLVTMTVMTVTVIERWLTVTTIGNWRGMTII